ncbi:MAG: SusC/RagA family TonB-linked outer membrane protein, partial [Massilibacteroides sp.]|nr:SusC/RagA family TonB-linked outer membrane protein [Massilibacteroides sp.]
MKRKTLLLLSFEWNKHIKDYFRIMKITIVLLFVCLFQLMAHTGNAQNALININSQILSVKELFNEIEKQTDYLLIFSDKEIDTNETVNVKKKSVQVNVLLQELFQDSDVEYLFENDYIVFKKKEGNRLGEYAQPIVQQTKKQIQGVVTDEKGEPIIGANIVEKGTTNGTITD